MFVLNRLSNPPMVLSLRVQMISIVHSRRGFPLCRKASSSTSSHRVRRNWFAAGWRNPPKQQVAVWNFVSKPVHWFVLDWGRAPERWTGPHTIIVPFSGVATCRALVHGWPRSAAQKPLSSGGGGGYKTSHGTKHQHLSWVLCAVWLGCLTYRVVEENIPRCVMLAPSYYTTS